MQSLHLTGKYMALLLFSHCIAYCFLSSTDAIVKTHCGQWSIALSDVSRIPNILIPEPRDHIV